MKITEFNSNLKITPVKFNVDNILGKNVSYPLAGNNTGNDNRAAFYALVGSGGSGKTTLLVSMITEKQFYKKCWNHIHVVMPKSSRDSIDGDIFKNHSPEKLYNNLTLEVLENVIASCEIASSKKEMSLLIIDDCAAELSNNKIKKAFSQIIFNKRHLRLYVIILVQTYKSLKLDLRKNITHLIMFKYRNKAEMKAISEELLFISKNEQEALEKYIWDNKDQNSQYNFLYVNTATNELFKNWNKLEITD